LRQHYLKAILKKKINLRGYINKSLTPAFLTYKKSLMNCLDSVRARVKRKGHSWDIEWDKEEAYSLIITPATNSRNKVPRISANMRGGETAHTGGM
jgi:hypothetical protein